MHPRAIINGWEIPVRNFRWVASIWDGSRTRSIGSYDTEIEAADAYKKKVAKREEERKAAKAAKATAAVAKAAAAASTLGLRCA